MAGMHGPPSNSDNAVLEALARLDAKLTKLEQQLEPVTQLATTAPDALAVLVDVFDRQASTLQARGVDIEQRLSALARIAEQFTTPQALKVLEALSAQLPSLELLCNSDALAPIQHVSQALVATSADEPPALGALGLLRALSDRDVQRTVGFAIAFARHFGHALNARTTTPVLPATTSGTP